MLSMSIPRTRLFPAILIATAAIAFAASHAIVGCLIQKPTLLAAEPQPHRAAEKTQEAIRLVSPNGKFYIRLEATDNGARITLAASRSRAVSRSTSPISRAVSRMFSSWPSSALR